MRDAQKAVSHAGFMPGKSVHLCKFVRKVVQKWLHTHHISDRSHARRTEIVKATLNKLSCFLSLRRRTHGHDAHHVRMCAELGAADNLNTVQPQGYSSIPPRHKR